MSHFNNMLFSAANIHVGKQNRARDLNFGWLHTCERNSVHEIASMWQSTKTNRCRLVLDLKSPRLSSRPRQKVGKISFKTQYQIQKAQICGKSSKIWMVLLIPIYQTKQCPTTVLLSPASNPKPTFSYTTMPGSKWTCYESIKISTINLRNVWMNHLLMLHFKWLSYYLPYKKWSAKE